jgi:hypothetical protein
MVNLFFTTTRRWGGGRTAFRCQSTTPPRRKELIKSFGQMKELIGHLKELKGIDGGSDAIEAKANRVWPWTRNRPALHRGMPSGPICVISGTWPS